jgi:hypothetical protein
MPMKKIFNDRHFTISIENPHLILCEGIDDKKFFDALLNSDDLNRDTFNLFQVEITNGKDAIKPRIEVLPISPGFNLLRSITIIRDADTNCKDAILSIKNIFSTAKFAVPKKPCCPTKQPKSEEVEYPGITTAFLLLPDYAKGLECGSLENLCLKILKNVKNEPNYNDNKNANNNNNMANLGNTNSIESIIFLDKIAEIMEDIRKLGYDFRCPQKNKLHTFFSLTNSFVSNKLGQAANAGAFDFNSPLLKGLKNFLINMAT